MKEWVWHTSTHDVKCGGKLWCISDGFGVWFKDIGVESYDDISDLKIYTDDMTRVLEFGYDYICAEDGIIITIDGDITNIKILIVCKVRKEAKRMDIMTKMDTTTNTITANTYMTTTNTSPYIPYSTQAMENLIFKVAEPAPSDIRPIKPNKSAIEISKDTDYVYHTGFGGEVTLGKIAKSTNAKVVLNIKNIKLLPNEESPRVVIVEFDDGSTEKAVTAKGDIFDFETGLSICLTKRILAALTGTNCGTKLYNDMIKQAVRAYDEIKEERAKEQELKEIADRKRAKKIAKKKARDERRRKAAINYQKEVYVQAMLELKSRQGDDCK